MPNPISQYLMIGKLIALLGAVAIICWQSSQIHRWHKQFTSEHAAHERDIAAYRQAQIDATAKNKAHVADVEAQQQRISDERLKDANNRLARLSDELRARGPAAQSHPNGAGSPALPNPSGGTADPAGLCLSPSQLLRAAQDEERHSQLIQWVEQQLSVDPNKP